MFGPTTYYLWWRNKELAWAEASRRGRRALCLEELLIPKWLVPENASSSPVLRSVPLKLGYPIMFLPPNFNVLWFNLSSVFSLDHVGGFVRRVWAKALWLWECSRASKLQIPTSRFRVSTLVGFSLPLFLVTFHPRYATTSFVIDSGGIFRWS